MGGDKENIWFPAFLELGFWGGLRLQQDPRESPGKSIKNCQKYLFRFLRVSEKQIFLILGMCQNRCDQV